MRAAVRSLKFSLRTLALCIGSIAALSGCNLHTEEKLIAEGIGTELAAEDVVEAGRRQDIYLSYLCHQAGMSVPSGDGNPFGICDMTRYGSAGWTLLVRAGFNDVDRRCDSYLAWLNARRRNRNAILSQITDTRNFTEAVMFTAGASATALTVAGLAFGLASNTFTNYYSRLLLEIEKSTVEVLVHEKRLQYRNTLNARITSQPDAIHVLREYLLICTPHYIENRINQRTRDSVAGNPSADDAHPEQIRRSIVAGALIRAIPEGGSRGKLEVRLPPAEPKMTNGRTDIERSMPKSTGQRIQSNLCVASSGEFDGNTRLAITQAKIGARQAELHIGGAPPFKDTSGQLTTRDEVQLFFGLQPCKSELVVSSLGYATAFEIFRFHNDAHIRILQERLAKCKGVGAIPVTGRIDKATRDAILKVMREADDASKKRFAFSEIGLDSNAYGFIAFNCNRP